MRRTGTILNTTSIFHNIEHDTFDRQPVIYMKETSQEAFVRNGSNYPPRDVIVGTAVSGISVQRRVTI